MRKNTILYWAILLIILNVNNFAYSLTENTSSTSLSSLKVTIIALDVTRKKSHQELATLNKAQNTSQSKEVNEYTVFIDYLAYQIKKYCLQIRTNYGAEALLDIPCKSMNIYNQQSVLDKDMQTSVEKIESLDDEFLNSLGDFDEMLLKEDELIASKMRKERSTTVASSKSSGNGKDRNNKEDSKSTDNGEISNQNSNTSKDGNMQKKSEKDIHSKKGLSPGGNQRKYSKKNINRRKTLDEIDDDIVARQLKEAAEKETNPELKERLWDEYYKYKQKTFN